MRDGKDEAWIGVQTRTFTRWCNSHLSDRQLKIESLASDLQSGVLLAQLLETISDKTIKHYANPGFKIKMIENLNNSLQFLAKEGIKVVNIGSEDIYENNLRLILGLIWTIILRYQINKGIAESFPKWLLLEWVKNQVRLYGIPEPRDFKTSWIDGRPCRPSPTRWSRAPSPRATGRATRWRTSLRPCSAPRTCTRSPS